MSQNVSHNRNSDIEVLRAAAILFTLCEHLRVLFPWPVPLFDGLQDRFMFTTGVDLFFVISGFVIARSLRPFREVLSGDDSGEDGGGSSGRGGRLSEWKQFWIKRLFRLLPSAWLWLLVPVLLATLLPANEIYPSAAQMFDEVVVGVLNIANLRFYLCGEFPAWSSWCEFPLMTGHYWSLALEEQFYLLLPLLLMLTPRRWLPLLLAVLIGSQVFHNRVVFSLAWFTRFDGLLWGVLLAICSERSWYARLLPASSSHRIVQYLLYPVLLLLLIWLPQRFGGGGFFAQPFTMSLVALMAAILVFCASYDRDYLLPQGRFKNALMVIATWSYALYLAHLPLFYFCRALYQQSGFQASQFDAVHAFLLVLSALGISFLSAALTYRWVEAPLRDYGRRLAQGQQRAQPSGNMQLQ